MKEAILYIYDITPKNKSDLNKIKRNFYYHLSKFNAFVKKATKSAIVVRKEHEKIIDNLFEKFYGNIEVWKCKVKSLELMKSK